MQSRQQSDETKNNTDLAVIRDRHQQRADSVNFLINWPDMPFQLTQLIFGYVSFHIQDIVDSGLIYFSRTPNYPGFFSVNSDRALLKYAQAETIARNHILTAGPLNELIEEAKKNPSVLLQPISINLTLAGINFTLKGSPLQLAIILLDQRIMSADPYVRMIDQGQAEALMDLIKDLIPDRLAEAHEQVRFAASFDPEEPNEKAKRLAVLNAAFDLIKENKFDEARQIIMDYINTKPEVITDNRFLAGLLQMVPEALGLLANRADELKEGLDGEQADQYCFWIGMIQRFFTFKLRKAMETGVYYLLYEGTNIDRAVDVRDAAFCSRIMRSWVLNISTMG